MNFFTAWMMVWGLGFGWALAETVRGRKGLRMLKAGDVGIVVLSKGFPVWNRVDFVGYVVDAPPPTRGTTRSAP